LIILVILAGIKPLEEWFQSRSHTHEITVQANHGKLPIETLEQTLGYRFRRVARYVASPSEDTSLDDILITVSRVSALDVTDIVRLLKSLPDVRTVAERRISH
jgi:putative Mg2+ transporter-C (MgtC) family protein